MGVFGRAIKKLTDELPKKAPKPTVSPAQVQKLPISGGVKMTMQKSRMSQADMLRAADAEIEGLNPKKK